MPLDKKEVTSDLKLIKYIPNYSHWLVSLAQYLPVPKSYTDTEIKQAIIQAELQYLEYCLNTDFLIEYKEVEKVKDEETLMKEYEASLDIL